jgi:hypothetical protein
LVNVELVLADLVVVEDDVRWYIRWGFSVESFVASGSKEPLRVLVG